MKSTDPSHMASAERLAELGEILAAGLQRLLAHESKAPIQPRNHEEQLDDLAAAVAPCGSPIEAP